MNTIIDSIDHIREERDISREVLEQLLTTDDAEVVEYLRKSARDVADSMYGKRIFLRGLIEISSHCKNDCLYCGLRRSKDRRSSAPRGFSLR